MIVLPVGLLYDRKKKSEPPVQNCCSLRVKEGCLPYCHFPTISRIFSAIFRNWIRTLQTATPPPCTGELLVLTVACSLCVAA